jgi:hypothetical protein
MARDAFFFAKDGTGCLTGSSEFYDVDCGETYHLILKLANQIHQVKR